MHYIIGYDFSVLHMLTRKLHCTPACATFTTPQTPPLFTSSDVDVKRPDDKSVITYVAAYYHYFAKMKLEQTGTKRVAKVCYIDL